MHINVFLSFCLTILFNVHGFSQQSDSYFDKNFKIGISFFNTTNPTEYTDNQAIYYLKNAIDQSQINKENAPVSIEATIKIGIIHQTYLKYPDAINYYLKAINIQKKFSLHDTTSYLAKLYLGMTYYYSNDYTQCYNYLKQAERVYLKYNLHNNSESLFNTLGVIFFESGNYRQSVNYFTKAQDILTRTSGAKTNAALQSNLASAFRNLGENQKSLAIYRSILKENPNDVRFKINLAHTLLELNKLDEAITELKSIKIDNDIKNQINFHNLLGRSYKKSNQLSASIDEFNKAIRIYNKSEMANHLGKNSDIGNTYNYLGDIAQQEKKYGKALYFYQNAIFHIDTYFKDQNIYKNPTDFIENFNNALLFNTLVAKGNCFKAMFLQKKTSKLYYNAAIDTYESATKLTNFLLNLYDNEEARLNLTKKIYPFYSNYVELLLQGSKLFNDPHLLEKAFILAEKSKSSVLAIDLNESFLQTKNKVLDSLMLKEQFLNMTKSKLRLNSNFNQQQNPKIDQQLNDLEINLSQIRNAINKNLNEEETNENKIWNIDLLKKKYLKNGRAIFTIYKINDNYHAFLLTKTLIKTQQIGSAKKVDFLIDLLNDKISNSLYGKTYTGDTQSQVLYDMFFTLFEKDLAEIKSLIIIPHFETVRLPFEVLKDFKNEYLLSKFEVLYQYSVDILLQSEMRSLHFDKMLASAPFIDASSGNILPASSKEIEGINGTKQFGNKATKQLFYETYKQHSIIHLATHATADNIWPEKSYVSFYPKLKDSLENRMYVDEIRLLDFKKVDLMFLSACETSAGKQIENEGIMSLSRAFSMAGCTNIVTSLWKAEDEATAYLSVKFYKYLLENHSAESALQLAKLDLLKDPKMIQFHSPAYWSHLIIIGVPQKPNYTYWYAGIFILLAIAVLLYLYFNSKKASYLRKNHFLNQFLYRNSPLGNGPKLLQ